MPTTGPKDDKTSSSKQPPTPPAKAAAKPMTTAADSTKSAPAPPKSVKPTKTTSPASQSNPHRPSPAASQIATIRQTLSAASESYWSELLTKLRANADATNPSSDNGVGDLAHHTRGIERFGDELLLTGVDYTLQRMTLEENRVVIHKQGDYLIGLALEPSFNAMISKANRVALAFGFDDSNAWDVICHLSGLEHSAETMGPSFENVTAAMVSAFRRPGQFVVANSDDAICVPGLDNAAKKLSAIHKTAKIPRVSEPKDLLPALVEILETNNISLFEQLWLNPVPEYILSRRFAEFTRALRACKGRLEFDRYDKPLAPETVGKHDQVRMFVKRDNMDGMSTSKPLTFVKTIDGWRLKAGSI